MKANFKKLRFLLLLNGYRLYFKLIFTLHPARGAARAFRLFATPLNKKVRPQETEALASARHFQMEINGKQIQLYEWGEGTKAALLVHGWETHAGSMGAFAKMLAEEGYRVLAFDGPAHGKSTGQRTNIFEFAEVIACILKQNRDVELLVTHSFGSGASIFALAENPGLSPVKIAMITSADRFKDVFSDFADVLKMSRKSREYLFRYLYQLFGRTVEEMQVSDFAKQTGLKQALLIHDRNDRILPFAGSERIAADWPAARLVPTEGKGHYRILWSEEVVEEVRALASNRRMQRV